MSAITVIQRDHEPVVSDTDWKRDWPCGCFVLTGWGVSGAATALFVPCQETESHAAAMHAAAMQRARERYAAMCAQPAAHRELATSLALDVIHAIATEELGA